MGRFRRFSILTALLMVPIRVWAGSETNFTDADGTEVTCWHTESVPSPDRKHQLICADFNYTLKDSKYGSGWDQFVRLIPGNRKLSPQDYWKVFNDLVPKRRVEGLYIKEAIWSPDSKYCVCSLLSPHSPASGCAIRIIPARTMLPIAIEDRKFCDDHFTLTKDGKLLLTEHPTVFDLQEKTSGKTVTFDMKQIAMGW